MRKTDAPEMRALFIAERERRQEAERRLAAHAARASENNTALAKNNLRLQEQLARLRGELDVLAHEAGCQRAATMVRERVAAQEMARMQAQLQRAAEEHKALRKQLAAKEGIISYLEAKLEEQQGRIWQTPALLPAAVSDCSGSGGRASAAQQPSIGESSDSLTAVQVGPEAAAAVGQMGQGESEGEQLLSSSTDDTGSRAGSADAGDVSSSGDEVACRQQQSQRQQRRKQQEESETAAAEKEEEEQQQNARLRAPPERGSPPMQHRYKAAAAEPTGQPLAAAAAAAAAAGAGADEVTPVRQGPPQDSSHQPAGTLLRSSLRTRNSGVSYALPSLRAKLRQGDPHTFGAAEAAAAGAAAGSARPRARTKPRPLFPQTKAGGNGSAVLPPVAD